MTCCLRASDVHFSYGAKPVLCGINLEVEHGEMLGIVGPNGAGKTTLFRILSGNVTPCNGEVCHNGKNLSEFTIRERARTVATVAQNPVVPVGFTALEVVLMGRNPHLGVLQWEGPRDIELALHMMELTFTASFANRQLSSLSGGERQRVFIARALAQQAPVLLLDEPTAHLDIGYQSDILDMIHAIRAGSDLTVIANIHDLSLAAQYCDRIAVMNRGAIMAIGKPEEILNRDMIRTAFGTDVSVISHPIYQTPVVLHGGRRSTTIKPD